MKVVFDADLSKVEKSAGKRPKAQIEIYSTEIDGIAHTASSIAAELMEMTGPVTVTIEPKQMKLEEDEDDDPASCEGQTAIPLAMHEGALLNKESGELIQLIPQPRETTLIEEVCEVVNSGALDQDGVTVTMEVVKPKPVVTDAYAVEQNEREAESLLASSTDALMDDAGFEEEDIPFLPTAEENAEAASGFSMEMPPEAPEKPAPATEAAHARLYPTRADLMLTKAQAGEVCTSVHSGVRFNAYYKDNLLVLEVEDTSPDAGIDAKTFFDYAGLDFTSRMDAGGKTMIFTATK